MRVVVDTNVLIDGLADDVTPQAKLIAAVIQGKLTAIVTPPIVREYMSIIRRLGNTSDFRHQRDAFLQAAQAHEPRAAENIVIDDPEDRKFIAAALGGQAELIITNDQHLLEIGEIGPIRVVRPDEAWRRFEEETDGQTEWKFWLKGLGLTVLIVLWLGGASPAAAVPATESVSADLAAKEAEIAALTDKIQELQSKKNTVAEEAELISNQVAAIAKRLAKSQLELRETQRLFAGVLTKKEKTASAIEELTQTIESKKNHLSGLIRLLYAKEQTSFVDVWLSSYSLSEVLAQQTAVKTLQSESLALMQDLQAQTAQLREQENALAQQGEELNATSRVLGAQQQALDAQKQEQDEFLAAKKAEQLTFEQKITEAKAAREEMEAGLFALKNAGVSLSFTTATDMAKHASELTGVRPSLLLAVLKIESNMGSNIGSGVFPDDMQPASREPFLRLAAKLGRDPARLPISRSVSYGWGGAMGPAQIMPQTWEGLEPRLIALLKKPLPDPYELTDAFVATALLLSDKGAASSAGGPAGQAGEREAVGRYLAGPNWQHFPWYVERVFAVAAEYQKEGML